MGGAACDILGACPERSKADRGLPSPIAVGLPVEARLRVSDAAVRIVRAPRKADAGVRVLRVDITSIVERLRGRTREVFADARGAERHARLCQRLERLYGALELARLLDQGALARWIETHLDAVRRDIETD